MKQNAQKQKLWMLISILLMLSIFLFSNQNGPSSQETSSFFSQWLTFMPHADFFVRKAAHFTIYGCLGFSYYQTLQSKTNSHKNIWIAIGFAFLYACSDEIHQLFSDGRSGQFSDVLLDTLGSAFFIIISHLLSIKH